MKRITFFILLTLLYMTLILCSCNSGFLKYSLVLNVKEYQNNKLTNCGQRKVTIEHNEQYVNFLDISLRRSMAGYFTNPYGIKYNYFYEVNDVGLILCTIAPNNVSYIISTKGKCP